MDNFMIVVSFIFWFLIGFYCSEIFSGNSFVDKVELILKNKRKEKNVDNTSQR